MAHKYLFCYTRTQNIDYRNIYGVDASVCPQSIQDIFLSRISALLNNTADENLNNPIYVYFRQEDIVLFGIACLNSVLSTDNCLDKTKGRVRGFFGVIEKTSLGLDSIPFSLDYYITMYEKYIAPKWTSFTFHYDENVEPDISFGTSDSFVKPMVGFSLNNDLNICRISLSTRLARNLLAEALAYKGNMSIATGISDTKQVTEDNYPLMNATLANDECRSYEDVTVFHICSKCGRRTSEIQSNGLCKECSDKLSTKSSETDDVSVQTEHEKCLCSKCGKIATHIYTEEKLCSDCYKKYVVDKKKMSRYIYVIICLLFLSLLTYLFLPKFMPNIWGIKGMQIDNTKNLPASTDTNANVESRDSLNIGTLSKK